MAKLANCIWFSRHDPSTLQIEELRNKRLQIAALEAGKSLGTITIGTEFDNLINKLLHFCRQNDAVAIVGSFPAPIQEMMTMSLLTWHEDLESCYTCYSAWNVRRQKEEGEPAVFEHYRFFLVGYLYNVLPFYNNNLEVMSSHSFINAGEVIYHG